LVDKHLDRFGGVLLPPRCVLCGSRGQAPCLDLCTGCEASFEAAGEPVLAGPEPLRRLCAPFAYAWPSITWCTRSSTGPARDGRVLGTLLARWLAARACSARST